MKCLVTGATGFVGSSIVRSLIADGQDVRALVRQGSDTKNLDGLDIEQAVGDITDYDSVSSAVKGCDAVFHAAALVRFWLPAKERKQFYEVNVQGTKHVLSACMKHDVERVVYTSTVSTIGAYGKDHPTTEEHCFNLWDMSMDYERSKYSAEFEAWRFAAKGLPLIVVLPAAPVGARDIKPNPIGQLILDFLGRKLPGYIEGGGNFIDVDDVADGHVLALHRGQIGERYILGHENLTVSQLFNLLEELSGVKAPRVKFPRFAAVGLAHILEFASDRITHTHPLLTVALAKFSSEYYFLDTSKATHELGFRPRFTIRQAAVKAIRWFLDHGYIKQRKKSVTSIRQCLDTQHALVTGGIQETLVS